MSRPWGKGWKSPECGGRSLSYPEKIQEAGGKFSILVLDRRSKQLSREFHLKLTKVCFGYSECSIAVLTFSVSLKYCNWFPTKVETNCNISKEALKNLRRHQVGQPVRTQPFQGTGGLGSICIFLRNRHHVGEGQTVSHRTLLCLSLYKHSEFCHCVLSGTLWGQGQMKAPHTSTGSGSSAFAFGVMCEPPAFPATLCICVNARMIPTHTGSLQENFQ